MLIEWVIAGVILVCLVILCITVFWPSGSGVAKRNKLEIRRLWTPDGSEAYAVRGVETEAEALEAIGGVVGTASVKLIPTADGITTWLISLRK